MNSRELLEAAADFLADYDEDISFGLKRPEDGLKLYRFFCESYDGRHGAVSDVLEDWDDKTWRKAIGYNPFKQKATTFNRYLEPETTK